LPTELKGQWLLSFNDMMTLLFAFFVLIVSMSRLEESKVKGMAAAVRKVVGLENVAEGAKTVIAPPVQPFSQADIEKAKGESLPPRFWDRKAALRKLLLSMEGVTILERPEGLAVAVGEPLLFASGTAELSDPGRRVLESLGEVLERTDVGIDVEGHTDDLPPVRGRFPTNWELSAARAVHVAEYLAAASGVAPERLSAAGYADCKPRAANLNAQNRQLNRRVEIILKINEN